MIEVILHILYIGVAALAVTAAIYGAYLFIDKHFYAQIQGFKDLIYETQLTIDDIFGGLNEPFGNNKRKS